MGKFSGVLICTDLDGTLYRNDKTISQENREAIDYFKREGGFFTAVGGRRKVYNLFSIFLKKEKNFLKNF